MRAFENAAEYCIALARDPSIAAITFQMAGEALDVGRAAIARQVKEERLEEIRVGKHRMVRASSVYDRVSHFNSLVATVENFLIDLARRGEVTSYGPVMSIVGLKPAMPADRKLIGQILGAISRKSWATNGFFLSAMVFKKDKQYPSDSFYWLAEDLDSDYKFDKIDAEQLLDKHLKAIFRYYQANN